MLRRLALLALLCVLASACRSFAGHPVRGSAPRLRAPAPSAGPVPEPAAPVGEEAAAALFRGLEGLHEPLAHLHARPLEATRAPGFVRLPRMEAAVRARYRGGGFGGAVRSVVVVAAVGRVPIAPSAMARMMMDPAVERALLAAQVLRPLGADFVLPGHERRRYWVELLGRGEGPFRFDLRFAFTAERWELADGRVLLRYDPQASPRPEHVTLFRGGCLLEALPDGGTRVSEILVLGTDLQLLPLFQGQLLALARKTLEDRATNLWRRAWQAAGR